jgi:hypothetical protein
VHENLLLTIRHRISSRDLRQFIFFTEAVGLPCSIFCRIRFWHTPKIAGREKTTPLAGASPVIFFPAIHRAGLEASSPLIITR